MLSTIATLLAWAVALTLCVALVQRAADYGRHGLQMDFSAYYTAGEALRRGFSPYVNNVYEWPPVWDGIDSYQHARFLYPPLAAPPFEPLTHLGYYAAKNLWTALTLGCVVGTLAFIAYAARARLSGLQLAVLVAGTAAFFPLLTHLERGQIDALVLLLLSCAFAAMASGRGQFAGGLAVAVACVLKVHCLYLVPFLLLRRKWPVLAGLCAGGAVLLVISLATQGSLLADYATKELPRIAVYGQDGPPGSQLPGEVLQSLGYGQPTVVKDGRSYTVDMLSFDYNATFVRPLRDRLRGTRLEPWASQSVTSIALICLFAGLFGLVGRRPGVGEGGIGWRSRELAYWMAVLMAILLSSPMTWTMNLVWVLPVWVLALPAAASGDWKARIGPFALLILMATMGVRGTLTALGVSPLMRYPLLELAVCLALLLRPPVPAGRPGESRPTECDAKE